MKRYGVLARNRGMWGGMESWCKGKDGKPLLYDTYDEAAKKAREIMDSHSNISNFTDYFPKEYDY